MTTETEKEVLKVLEERWEKGRESYGKGIEAGDYSPHHWLSEAIEEAADLLQYLVALKMKTTANYVDNRPCNVCGLYNSPYENTVDHIGFFCNIEHYLQWTAEQRAKGFAWRSMGMKKVEVEK